MRTDLTGRLRLSWEETALRLAFNIAEYRSQDPYVIVGSCIIKQDFSFVLSYNGAPMGVEIDWSSRDERRKRVLHAESNGCNFIKPGEGRLIAVTALPCPECMKIIKQKQIPKIIYGGELGGYDNEFSKVLAKEFNIELAYMDIK